MNLRHVLELVRLVHAWVAVQAALLLGAALATFAGGAAHAHVPPSRVLPVLIIGGSATAGWHDRTHQGFVVRGLSDFATPSGLTLHIRNHAIPGARVVNPTVNRDLTGWLRGLGPDALVVVAWGMLNDLRLATPPKVVSAALHQQMRDVLAHHDTLLVVTPAATRASYQEGRKAEARLVDQELAVARQLAHQHAGQVFIANVFAAMKTYLKVHHISYRTLMAGRWDPNTAGHRLAGRILARLLRQAFAQRPTFLHRIRMR